MQGGEISLRALLAGGDGGDSTWFTPVHCCCCRQKNLYKEFGVQKGWCGRAGELALVRHLLDSALSGRWSSANQVRCLSVGIGDESKKAR